MAVTDDLPLTLGRNLLSLTYESDLAERASRIAPISAPLGGQPTLVGFARWGVTDPDSSPKTLVARDPAGGAGPIGFDTQCVNWYVLLERTGESFRITATVAATQLITLATWSGAIVEGERFQLRMSAPGTTLAAYAYRMSVASVIPPPPGIPIIDAEVTALAGDVITVRDGWLSGGPQPVATTGQHVGRSVRLSELVATDSLTSFATAGNVAIYGFADVSGYQVGDWIRRAVNTSYPYADINTVISPAFPAAMTIIGVDTGANTVTVVSRDGGTSLGRALFDHDDFEANEVRIYRPVATLRTVAEADGTAHTLTLDDTSGFSIAGGNGAVEILIASVSTSGKVPWYLEHPVYVQEPPTGIGVQLRTTDYTDPPWYGVQNLVDNGVVRVWSDLAKLPDGYLFSESFASTTDAPTPGGFFNFARETNPLYTRVGGQSLFVSATGGTLVFPPIAWTPQFQGQQFSARLSLLLTTFANPASWMALRFGILLADGSILPWYEPLRSVQIQPAGPNAPGRPVDFYTRFPTNVWDDLRLFAFDITEPSAYPANLRPNASDIADVATAQGIVPLLTFEAGAGERIEGYIDGIAVTPSRETPPDVKEFYDANRLHQDTNKLLREFGPPQFTIGVDFFDAKRMNPSLDEPDAKKGVVAEVDVPSLGIEHVRRRITDVWRNMNVPGDSRITLGRKRRRLSDAAAKPPATKPPPPPGSSTSGAGSTPPATGGSVIPTMALDATLDPTTHVAGVTAFVSASVRSVRFAVTLAPADPPTEAEVLAGTLDETAPYGFAGPALAIEQTAQFAAIAFDVNGERTAVVRKNVTRAAVDAWLDAQSGIGYWQDVDKLVPASENDRAYTWEDQGPLGHDLPHRYPATPNMRPIVQQGGKAIRFGDAAMTDGTNTRRGAYKVPASFSALTQAEIIMFIKRQAAPFSSGSGDCLMHLGGAANSEELFPDAVSGKWLSRFGTTKTYDCGLLLDTIRSGSDDAFHVIRIQTSATRWAAYLDGILRKEDTDAPDPAFDISEPVIGERVGASGSTGFFNGWIAVVGIFATILSDDEAAAYIAARSIDLASENLRVTEVSAVAVYEPSDANVRATEISATVVLEPSDANVRATEISATVVYEE